MLREFSIQNFGCVQQAAGKLTPLHAFVGPNDSGKSTLLRAMGDTVGYFGVAGRFDATAKAAGQVTVWLRSPPAPREAGLRVTFTPQGAPQREFLNPDGSLAGSSEPLVSPDWIGAPVVVRLDADAMKQPSPLKSEEQASWFPTARGSDIAGVYDAILGRGDGSFQRITEQVRRLFPAVANIRVDAFDSSTKILGAKLVDGTVIRAEQMSEGLLYFLAFAAIREVCGAKLLLVEEPENGLHPARIREIMALLRGLTEQGTQVLMATHSPLVINELRPEEVSVVTRDVATGTRVTPMVETANFAERSKVYALGELWLSYCDGEAEAELLRQGRAA